MNTLTTKKSDKGMTLQGAQNSNKKQRENSRGISVDNSKASPKGISQMSFNRLVAQTNKSQEMSNRNFYTNYLPRTAEKVHSQSPVKRIDPQDFLIPNQTSSKLGKKTLVLDLDETLIHSGFQPFECGSDIVLKIEIENKINDIHVVKRPGVDEFLEKMGKLYEVVIFTASLSKYADPLMDILDKDRVCSFRLFRESCTMVNEFYVKELKRLNRNMKNIILLDNNPASYFLDIENGLPIKSFYDDKTDNELYLMSYVLENLAHVNDVREYIKEIVHMNQINYERVQDIFSTPKKLVKSESPSKQNNRYSTNGESATKNEILEIKKDNEKEKDDGKGKINKDSNTNSNETIHKEKSTKSLIRNNSSTNTGKVSNKIVNNNYNTNSSTNSNRLATNSSLRNNSASKRINNISSKGNVYAQKNSSGKSSGNKLKILSVELVKGNENNSGANLHSINPLKKKNSISSISNSSGTFQKQPSTRMTQSQQLKKADNISLIRTSSKPKQSGLIKKGNNMNLISSSKNRNDESLSEMNNTQQTITDKLTLTKRPSSVKPKGTGLLNRQISNGTANTASTSVSTSIKNIKPSSSVDKRNRVLNKTPSEKGVGRKTSSNSFSNSVMRNYVSKSKTNSANEIPSGNRNGVTNQILNDFQRSLELEVRSKIGNNTTRHNTVQGLKNTPASKNIPMNKSLSPSPNKIKDKFIKDSVDGNIKLRPNPITARQNSNFLNFRKDQKERPDSKEKFNSLMTSNKLDGKINNTTSSNFFGKNTLSNSQHSTNSIKIKSSSFNSLSNNKLSIQSELKMVKVLANNKSLNRPNKTTGVSKENNKTK